MVRSAVGRCCAMKAGWPRPTRHASSGPPVKRIECGADSAVAAAEREAARPFGNQSPET
jgi:hypothetical protein